MPTTTLRIGGTAVDRPAANVTLVAMTPFVKDGVPTMSFARRGIAPPLRPDPYLGKAVTLAIDGTTYFAGDVAGLKHHHDEQLGWVAEYQCLGLRHRGDLVPVDDDQTRRDVSAFNLTPGEYGYLPARAGRTLGQMIRMVLEGTANRTALSAQGLGAYVGSALPASTLADLDELDIIPPHRVTFQGDRLLDAVEAALKRIHPNHCIHIEPATGAIRFLDLRAFTPLLLTLGTDPIRPPEFDYDTSDCFSAVVVKGEPLVEPVELALSDGSLAEDFAHDGLSIGQAKERWKYGDFNQPSGVSDAAQATCNLTPTSVDHAEITNPGYAYTSAPIVTVVNAGTEGSGAAFTASIAGGRVTALTKTASGSGYVRPPSLFFSGGNGAGAAGKVILTGTSVAAGLTLVSGGSHYEDPPAVKFRPVAGGPGSGAAASTTLTGDTVSSITLTAGGTGYVIAPAVHIGGPFTPTTDYGTCDSATGTTVIVRSDDVTRTWKAAAWDNSVVILRDTVLPGVTSSVTRRVVASTALAAGGTATLTLDLALPTAATYTLYSLYNTASGASLVWRRYRPTDESIAAAMTMDEFAFPFAYQYSEGAASLTSFPVGTVHFSSGGEPPYTTAPIGFDLDPVGGTITTHLPVVRVFGTTPNLATGGPSTDGIPADVRFLVGVHKGSLSTRWPAVGHEGTAHAVEGIERVLTVSVADWRDPGQEPNLVRYAQDLLDSVKDTVIEGDVEYLGFLPAALSFGRSLDLAASGFETGLEEVALPIVGASLLFGETGGPHAYVTRLAVSNRRAKFSAGDYFAPTQWGPGWLADVFEPMALGGTPIDAGSAAVLPDLASFGRRLDADVPDFRRLR